MKKEKFQAVVMFITGKQYGAVLDDPEKMEDVWNQMADKETEQLEIHEIDCVPQFPTMIPKSGIDILTSRYHNEETVEEN